MICETRFNTIDFHGEKVKVTYGVLIPNDNSFCYVKQINDKNYAVLKRGLLPGEQFKPKKGGKAQGKGEQASTATATATRVAQFGPNACLQSKVKKADQTGSETSALVLRTPKDARHLVK